MADYKPSWNNFMPQDFMDDDSVDALVGGDEEALRQYVYQNRRRNEKDDGSEELMRLVAQNQIEDAVRKIQAPQDPNSLFGEGGAMDRGGVPEAAGTFGKAVASILFNPAQTWPKVASAGWDNVKDYVNTSPNLAYAMGGEAAGDEAKRRMNVSEPASAAEFQKRQIEALLSDLDKSDSGPVAPDDYHITQDFGEAKKKFRDGSGGTFSKTHFRTPLTKKMEDEARQLEMASALGANESRDKLLPDLIKGLTETSKAAGEPKLQKEMMANFLGATDGLLPPEVSGVPRADENPSLTDKDRTKVGKATALSPSDLMAARIAELKRRAKSKKLTKEDIEEIFGAKLSENKTKK